MSDVSEIAAQARAAFAAGIGAGWDFMADYHADVITIDHIPPEPTDGPVDGPTAAAYMHGTAEALERLPEFSTTCEIEAKGDQMILQTAQHFRGVDGEPVTFHGELVYHFNNGRVVRIVSTDEQATHPKLVEAVAAAGGIGPSPWRDRDEFPSVQAPPE